MATLSITNLYPNSVSWKLEDLDSTYNRSDRKICFQIIEKTSSGEKVIVSSFSGTADDIQKIKDKNFVLNKEVQTAKGTWNFSKNLTVGKVYFLKAIIYFSVQGIEKSVWGNVDNMTYRLYFPNNPNFNCGNYPSNNLSSAFGEVAKESKINGYYHAAMDDTKLTTNPQRINSINQAMINLCYNSKTKKPITPKILQWYPFPSGEEIFYFAGEFTWKKWLEYKGYQKGTTVKPLQTELMSFYGAKVVEKPTTNTEENDGNSSNPTWGYDNDWLKPQNNIAISTSATTQYKALFPPILESYQPAFVGKNNGNYEIFFRLSNYTNFAEIAHVDLRVTLQSNNVNVVNTDTWTDEIIYKIKNKKDGSSEIKSYGNGLYSVIIYANARKDVETKKSDLLLGHWADDTYYKVQMRLGTEWTGWEDDAAYYVWRDTQIQTGQFSEWSTPMILKSITAPDLYFINNYKAETMAKNYTITEFSNQPLFTAIYKQNGNLYTEPIDTYKFILSDSQKNIIEETEWIQYKEYSQKEITIQHRFSRRLLNGNNYFVRLKIITKNLYELETQYNFRVITLDSLENLNFNNQMVLLGETDSENGIIKLILKNNLNEELNICNNLVLTRQKVGDTKEIEMYKILSNKIILKPNGFKEIYTDFTVENEVGYNYFLYIENAFGQRGNPLKCSEIKVGFENFFLLDHGRQLKIKYNPEIKSFKRTLLTTKQDTLGGKYPIILQNGMTDYIEFPIGGLISLHAEYDGFSYFLNKDLNALDDQNNNYQRKIHEKTEKPYINCKEIQNKENFNLNLISNNIRLEKEYRDKVEQFLNNGNYKLFRSPTEGNYIVGLIQISLTPNQQLGRLISTFSAQAYEVAEYSIENLHFHQIIDKEKNEQIDNRETYLGQIAGFFDDETNLLEVIANNLDSTKFQFLELNAFTLEPYPHGWFEKQKTYLTQKEEFEQLAELEKLIMFYDTQDLVKYIHLSIGSGGQEVYNGIVLNDKKLCLDNLNLSLNKNDYIKIVNKPTSVPVILTFTAKRNNLTQREYIEYAYDSLGYDQLEGQFSTKQDQFYNDNGILVSGDKTFYNTTSITEAIFRKILKNLEIQGNILLPIENIKTKNIDWVDGKSSKETLLSYEDEEFIIDLKQIPWIEIEARENIKLLLAQPGPVNNFVYDWEQIRIGKTEKLILENLINEKQYVNLKAENDNENNYFIINYSYQISVTKKRSVSLNV